MTLARVETHALNPWLDEIGTKDQGPRVKAIPQQLNYFLFFVLEACVGFRERPLQSLLVFSWMLTIDSRMANKL